MVLFHYSMWIDLGEATGTSALSLAPHSTKHPLPPMAWKGLGKIFLPPHCGCIQPWSCYFVVERNPSFETALYVVPRMLTFIRSLKQPFSWNNSGSIRSARRDYVSACWQRTWLSARTMSNKWFPSSSPQSVFTLNMCGCIVNPG